MCFPNNAWDEDLYQFCDGEEGARGGDGVSPREPPVGLPDLRPGRRVRFAGLSPPSPRPPHIPTQSRSGPAPSPLTEPLRERERPPPNRPPTPFLAGPSDAFRQRPLALHRREALCRGQEPRASGQDGDDALHSLHALRPLLAGQTHPPRCAGPRTPRIHACALAHLHTLASAPPLRRRR